MNAEASYLFRHALLREAAYQLHLPADRTRLHRTAFDVIERLSGGAPPEPPPLDVMDPPAFQPHPTDAFAEDLAAHALAAGRAGVALYLRRSAEIASRQFRPEAAQETWTRLAARLDGPPRGAALRRASAAAQTRGRMREAEDLLHEALAHVREPRHQAQLHSALSSLYRVTARAERSEKSSLEAARLFRESGDSVGENRALAELAMLYVEDGRVEEAGRFLKRNFDSTREAGDRRSEAFARMSLALYHLKSARFEEAERLQREALELHRSYGNRQAEGVLLGNLGNVLHLTGRFDEALRTQEQALAIHREVGNRRLEGVALGTIANFQHGLGRIAEAERTYFAALAVHREVGDRFWEGLSLGNFACLYRDTGRHRDAARAFDDCLAVFRDLRQPGPIGTYSCERALLHLTLGEHGEAKRLWLEGIALVDAKKDVVEAKNKRESMREACAKAGVPPFSEAR